jgi:large subunit ribosomal protein L23
MSIFDRLKKKKQETAGKEEPRVKGAEKEPEKKRPAKKAPAKKEAAPARKAASRTKGLAQKILLNPVISEKSAVLASENKYVFAVAPEANKIQVKRAVTELYGVRPIDVNIVNVKGKNVRFRRVTGRTKGWKKAIVTLPKGQHIEVYEGV